MRVFPCVCVCVRAQAHSCWVCSPWMAAGSESQALTSAANSGQPVWMWLRSSESSRCSPPPNTTYTEPAFLFPSVGSAWIKTRKPGRKTSCCASITSNRNNASAGFFVFFSFSPLPSSKKTSAELNLPTRLFLYCCADCWSAIRSLSWLKAPAGPVKVRAALDE